MTPSLDHPITRPGQSVTYVPGSYHSTFDCPEWSHLSAPDATEFSKRLVPHLKTALGK